MANLLEQRIENSESYDPNNRVHSEYSLELSALKLTSGSKSTLRYIMAAAVPEALYKSELQNGNVHANSDFLL